MINGTINWDLLEKIVLEEPLLLTFSKNDTAELRSLERYGYIHIKQYRVQVSAKGLNALTQHSTGGTHDELAARIKQLEAANDALRAALLPFALAAEDDGVKTDSEHTSEQLYTYDTLWEHEQGIWFDGGNTPLTRSHLRAAADAMGKAE